MRHTDHGSESGQGLVEYALMLASVVLIGLATVIVLSGAINEFFGSTSNSPNGLNLPTFNHPTAPGPITPVQWPTSVQQCLHGRWHNYPQFKDQASCVQFVTGTG